MRVNFHCHSDLSDGSMPPQRLAEALARSGVACAALTDHDTTEGLERFDRILEQSGVGFLPGVEITLDGPGGVHLLALGFDPGSEPLQALLRTRRQGQGDGGNGSSLSAAEVIGTVHRAGGRVYLAHPLTVSSDPAVLDARVAELRAAGLDGIEAIYDAYSPPQQAMLMDLADRHGLLICAGSDFHGYDRAGLGQLWVDFPAPHWERFRRAHAQWRLPAEPNAAAAEHPARPIRRRIVNHVPAFPWKRYVLRTIFPTVLAMGLFVVSVFAVVIPFLEHSLLERKRDVIRELTRSAWSIPAELDRDVQAGLLSLDEAQQRAISRLESLRYGKQRKDYFWVTDLQPRMILHPYRRELNGADLSEFADVRGRRLFAESVKLAREKGEGFVQYYWQWNDNPERVAPKESFVRLFEPWGWIIGTGMYLDDVHADIDALTRRLVHFCIAISAAVMLLLGYIARENLRSERQRGRAEAELRESHEKYAALVEASTEGTLMVLDGRCAYANRSMLAMLGYGEGELPQLTVRDIFPPDEPAARALARIDAMMAGHSEPQPFETQLLTRDRQRVDAVLTLTRIAFAGKSGFILVARDVTHQRPPAAWADAAQDARTTLALTIQPLRQFAGPLVLCAADTTIARAAALMSRHGASALGVTATAGGPVIGIVTDQDLRDRVLATGRDGDRPVLEIMTAPLLSLPASASAHEALATLQRSGVDHLAVRGADGRVSGIVRGRDLLRLLEQSPAALIEQIRSAPTPEALADARRQLPTLAGAMLQGGCKPTDVARFAARTADAATQRLIELTIATLGAPPVEFCFMALGSQGRLEQTLVSDQDNAIVYRDPPPERSQAAEQYFRALAERVSAHLAHAGYAACRGGTMASNPRWCRPLADWRGYFAHWIGSATPQDLLQFNTFFDLRGVAGQAELTAELRGAIQSELDQQPAFFIYLAQNALLYKPPIGFFGQIVTEAAGSAGPSLNLKDAMMPIANFARLYALKYAVPETGTLDRLERLDQLGILKSGFAEELTQAWTLMLELRLRHQARALAANPATPSDPAPADNAINPKTLTPLQQTMLKQCLALVATVQKKISYDFLGRA